ncbi:MAG TPA: aminoacyl-tRNA hydrolase [Caldisericia bacterium]|nr:MAG: Peptidyl-tRNA hydrolase [bacterium ADurb.Bin132]HOG70760.1 aminoacyl-tRNA hydrolase [Caldisericia bacterium]HPA65148.1 aminoacyl-tRNA hydrolase [Caldisericia bacterium]HQL68351.1 aminoacyl-tRNA hydrolase [Caldisericia bacterium]HQN36567.1 aminoacyl-tRNA hydrolase [Caldisericia bacterium]
MEKWLIAGLGNPGLKYAHTRHNVGFDAVDALAKLLKTRISRMSCGAKITRVALEELEFVIAKPLSFMNLSGGPVNCLANANQIPSDHWIIIHDDIDLPSGALRIRKSGSNGGHKGIASIMQETGKSDFYRIKIGVGRPETKNEVVDFVLSRTKDEGLEEAIKKAAQACLFLIEEGYQAAGNKFNFVPKDQDELE